MEAYFKQEDEKLVLHIDARTNLERTTLEEFMQQEISGYRHSFHYDYDKEKDKLKVHFRSIINRSNLLKEGFKDEDANFPNSWFFFGIPNSRTIYFVYKYFGQVIVVVNYFGSVFVRNGITGKYSHKRVSSIKELRRYIKKNENIWKSYS